MILVEIFKTVSILSDTFTGQAAAGRLPPKDTFSPIAIAKDHNQQSVIVSIVPRLYVPVNVSRRFCPAGMAKDHLNQTFSKLAYIYLP